MELNMPNCGADLIIYIRLFINLCRTITITITDDQMNNSPAIPFFTHCEYR